MRPIKQINILILGETGVGKSTWINAILNYLTYDTMEEAAEAMEVLHAVPMSFTITNDNYEQVPVAVGEDKNENQSGTSSATQYPKSYTFSIDDCLVRLIDTPGIGDTNGIEPDKINFQNILSHLSYIDEIHGICILLKPNEPRLTPTFRFCIKELLIHLHRDASRNIVFCFTNGRNSQYKPGETLGPLRKLLGDMKQKTSVEIPISKHTLYVFDNEAVRFLAAWKQRITFSEAEKKIFSESWNKSVEETKRLMHHVMELSPHMTKETLSLNEVRRMILELTRPLAEIGKNIRDNIAILTDKEEEIKRIDLKRQDLEKYLRIPVIELVVEELGYPRTVCASPKCVERVRGLHGVMHTVYKQVCHDRCRLKGVAVSSTNERALQTCRAMKGFWPIARCKHCECSWFEHMHQTFAVTKKDTFETNAEIQEQLASENNTKAAAEAVTSELRRRISQLEKEETILTKSSAKFAVYLKKKSLAPYNDATVAYLDHLISVENDQTTQGKGKRMLDALNAMKMAHEKEKQILEDQLTDAVGGTDADISPEKIHEEIEALRKLPMTGPLLVTMMEETKKATQHGAAYMEVSLNALQIISAKGKKISKFFSSLRSKLPH